MRNVLRLKPCDSCFHKTNSTRVNRVKGLEPGLYRYLPLENKLYFLYADAELIEKVHDASNKQYVKNSVVTFIWTVIPYRTEWRYSIVSPKAIA